MSTELEQVLRRLDSLEAKLDAIASQLVEGEAAPRTQHLIDWVQRYTSNSGNTTWKAFNPDGDIIYLRQAHKDLLKEAGLWDSLNAIRDSERCMADIVLYTVPDGDFMKPVEIEAGGWVKVRQPDNPGLKRLKELVASGDFVILDTETTSLNGHVCQIGILSATDKTLLDTLVKPPVKISAEATAVHGITNSMVVDKPPLESLKDQIMACFVGKTVIGWNVRFDLEALGRDLNFPDDSIRSEDAMQIFAPIFGEWNDYRQNYKWQSLTTAAAYYDISTDGAHSALADCEMTLEVIQKMVTES